MVAYELSQSLRLNHLPGVLDTSSPVLGDMVTLAHAGMILTFRKIDFVPIRTLKIYSPTVLDVIGRFYGRSVIKALHAFRKPNALDLRLMDLGGIDEVGRVDPTETLAEILNVMDQTNFGHVAVIKPHTLEVLGTVSLRDLVRYAPSFGLNESLGVGALASPLLSAAPETTLAEVTRIMLEKGVRRLAVRGPEQQALMIDDRAIAQYLFSPEGLAAWKESPDKFFETRAEDLQLARPGAVTSEAPLLAAWPMIYANKAECLIVDDDKILTPWDAIIKPYRLDRSLLPGR